MKGSPQFAFIWTSFSFLISVIYHREGFVHFNDLVRRPSSLPSPQFDCHQSYFAPRRLLQYQTCRLSVVNERPNEYHSSCWWSPSISSTSFCKPKIVDVCLSDEHWLTVMSRERFLSTNVTEKDRETTYWRWERYGKNWDRQCDPDNFDHAPSCRCAVCTVFYRRELQERGQCL